MATDVRERLRAILSDVLVLSESEIRPESKMVEDLDADSLAFIELSWQIHDEFGVQMPEPQITEESLSLPLLEGLRELQASADEESLFEYIGGGLFEDAGPDEEIQNRVADLFTEILARRDNRRELKAALDSDPSVPQSSLANVATLLANAHIVRQRVEALAETDELVRSLLDVGATSANDAPADGGLGFLMEAFPDVTVNDFSTLLGTSVPSGLDPDRSIRELELRDLFRFITVDAYTRYVTFLCARPQRADEPHG